LRATIEHLTSQKPPIVAYSDRRNVTK